MNLTQLTTLKTRLGLREDDVKDDTLLAAFIESVSGRFEAECNRRFARTVGATFQFRADEMNVFIDRYPIESVSAFHTKANEADGWQDAVADYLFNSTASIIELASALGSSAEVARVTFTGGYVLPGTTPDTSQTALPNEIEGACLEQCASLYQNKDRLGISSMSGQGGGIVISELDLLPSVKAVLKKFERWHP
jgi:hypothetical protein